MHRTVTVLSFSLVLLVFVSACSSSTLVPWIGDRDDWTGDDELDRIIEVVLSDARNALISLIQFTQSKCSFVEGIGGPPKCREGELEGETIEVLPFLGWEGHFIRKEEISSWEGLSASRVYAAYTVVALGDTDPNYPRGTHAIVFIDNAHGSSFTLQIAEEKIVRIDLGLGPMPEIREEDVGTYILSP